MTNWHKKEGGMFLVLETMIVIILRFYVISASF